MLPFAHRDVAQRAGREQLLELDAAVGKPVLVHVLQQRLDRRPHHPGGWLFSAFYHLCNGIRHLFWDAGYGFELKDAYRSGWTVVVVSLIATALSWIVGLRLI